MRRFFHLAILALIVLAAAACGSGGGSSSDKPTSVPDGYVAVVGSDKISVKDLNHQVQLKLNALKANKQKPPKAGSAAYRDQIVQPLVESLVYAAQLRRIAGELGIKVTSDDITKALDKDIKQYYGGNRQRYEADLKKFGVSEKDVREQIGLNLIQTKVQEKILKEVKVTDADLKKYYDQHSTDYATKDTRKVEFILVNGKATAAKARAELAGGAKWSAVAKKYAIAPGPPSTGGDLTAQKGSLEKNFEQAAFDLSTDTLSQPVLVSKTYASTNLAGKCKPDCFFLIRPTADVVKGTQQSFASVKQTIKQTLEQQKQQEHLQKRVKALLGEAKSVTLYAPQYKPASTSGSGSTNGSSGSTTGG
jgi:foldase protein PrsA